MRRAHDVVLGLLRGERRAAGLDVRAQHPRVRVLGAEALAQELRPHAAQRAVLRDLFEEVVVRVEDPRDARRDLVDVDAASAVHASMYAMAFAKAKPISCAAVEPASRM